MVKLIARSPLRRHVAPLALPSGQAGVRLSELSGLTISNVSGLKGRQEELFAAVKETFGVELPTTPRANGAGGVTFLWAGPDKWLAVAEKPTRFSLLPAAVSDQSDGRAVLQLSGEKARETLSSLASVDLHPRSFAVGDVALTHAASIAVQLWQVDDLPTINLVCFRTFSATLWRWLVHAGGSRSIAASHSDV